MRAPPVEGTVISAALCSTAASAAAAAEAAVEHNAALITVPSTGGARMQEGILSLMQLPRTILAIEKVCKALQTFSIARMVRGNCISDRIPSCMRAPPVEGTVISAALCSTAASAAAAAEAAVEHNAALITVPSTGGARMQEGILSLMQLPRTILAIEKVCKAGLPHIVLLAHPTTGGVTASFAMLGDLQIAEPGAIIGFAGRRVIEETVREKLPDDFQTAEYLQEHGMVDSVVGRADQPAFLARILGFLMEQRGPSKAA